MSLDRECIILLNRKESMAVYGRSCQTCTADTIETHLGQHLIPRFHRSQSVHVRYELLDNGHDRNERPDRR